LERQFQNNKKGVENVPDYQASQPLQSTSGQARGGAGGYSVSGFELRHFFTTLQKPSTQKH